MDQKSLRALLHLSQADGRPDFQKCGMPPHTFWYQLQQLEKKVGTQLFVREHGHAYLTNAGVTLAGHARKILEAIDLATSETQMSDQASASYGSLRVATTKAMASSWLIAGLKEFVKRHQVKIDVSMDDFLTPDQMNAADVFIRPLHNSDRVNIKWRLVHRFGLFASKEYLKENGMPECGRDLLQHTIIAYGPSPFTGLPDIDWHLNGSTGDLPPLTPRIIVNSTSAIASVVQQGFGIAALPYETSIFYNYNLVRVLPDIEGPVRHTIFGVKVGRLEDRTNSAKALEEFVKKSALERGFELEEQG